MNKLNGEHVNDGAPAAFDAVQDSMPQLVRAYAARAPAEWKPLFYRIHANRTRNLQRRTWNRVRSGRSS